MAASFIFYIWGGGGFIALLVASVIVNYAFGLAVEKVRGTHRHKLVLGIAIAFNVGILSYYKYMNFFVTQVNDALGAFTLAPVQWTNIALPIGISFFTFHSISYLLDISRGKSNAFRNIASVFLYIVFFPQLIAGPIVRFNQISEQIRNSDYRRFNAQAFTEGSQRFIFGLFKKVMIADPLGEVAAALFDGVAHAGVPSMADSWVGVLAYTLQIYFDFSAYSDMAIGLARIFGFVFPENFNRPYSANSITDFWRRWHISLSSWFRDYVYYPLGGSHCSKFKTYRNLSIVFLLTGFWHGANWTFLIWGAFHGAWLILERATGMRDNPSPAWIVPRRALTAFLVILGWVVFRSESAAQAFSIYGAMFDPSHLQLSQEMIATLSHRNILTLVLASGVFLVPVSFCGGPWIQKGEAYPALAMRGALTFIGLPLVVSSIVGGTFSPFLYFQF
ncbi:MAG: MBOAT family protein [Alphaproteobacteria bacterium]|nr:MBOAT family protein [Alphaproteobacteria bacterium]